MKAARDRRVAVIGLDSVPADLLFGHWIDRLPHLGELARQGTWGVLRSCDPPITVPAWASMLSGRDPGELGIYGFHNRTGHGYSEMALAHSHCVSHERVWDIAGRAGKTSVIAGIPLTYPTPHLRGSAVSCFLTPSRQHEYAWPPSLRAEVERIVPDYVFDVTDFRTHEKSGLRQRIFAKSSAHFRLARHLAAEKPWDFFMMVEMGPDRMQHAFWPERFDPEGELFEYYRFLDAEIGRLVECLGDVSLLVVSDHGAQALQGGFFINEWLIRHGYLRLIEKPHSMMRLRPEMVDWSRTRAWAEGGYVGRIYLNVAGREPRGVVVPGEFESLRDELTQELRAIEGGPSGPVTCDVWRPEDRYRECRGIAPDLMLYVNGLRWRALGSVGVESLFHKENDLGPDGANHHPDGIFLWCPATGDARGQVAARNLLDVAPTLLVELGIEIPPGMRGIPFQQIGHA